MQWQKEERRCSIKQVKEEVSKGLRFTWGNGGDT